MFPDFKLASAEAIKLKQSKIDFADSKMPKNVHFCWVFTPTSLSFHYCFYGFKNSLRPKVYFLLKIFFFYKKFLDLKIYVFASFFTCLTFLIEKTSLMDKNHLEFYVFASNFVYSSFFFQKWNFSKQLSQTWAKLELTFLLSFVWQISWTDWVFEFLL